MVLALGLDNDTLNRAACRTVKPGYHASDENGRPMTLFARTRSTVYFRYDEPRVTPSGFLAIGKAYDLR